MVTEEANAKVLFFVYSSFRFLVIPSIFLYFPFPGNHSFLFIFSIDKICLAVTQLNLCIKKLDTYLTSDYEGGIRKKKKKKKEKEKEEI